MNSSPSPQSSPPRSNFFADLSIGAKLGVGFGFLALLILMSGLVSYFSSSQAAGEIQKTANVRVPVALSASRAQAHLLRMLSDVRGYLALGEKEYRESYQLSAAAFERELAALEENKPSISLQDRARLEDLTRSYEKWKPLPEQLFDLRDDQLDREPAYRKLATDGVERAGNVIIALNQMIDEQSRKEPTPENMEILGDMSKFQGSFLPMISALRGYVTTRNPAYRYEYETNSEANERYWERLQTERPRLTDSQQRFMDTMEEQRTLFLKMPEEIFLILESEQWRVDLYRFKTEALPLAEEMDKSLSDLVKSQQATLKTELQSGQRSLVLANFVIAASGFLAFVVGLAMTYAARRLIARPIARLTRVAEQIRQGALDTLARVESRDEIGLLASTFNAMTAKLRETLFQVRKEKKRADDLLEVVIPIGVELSTEKDFNRLLEKMLVEAKAFCRADTGVLYMVTPNDKLDFVIVRSDSLNLALGGTSGEKPAYAALPLKVDGELNQGNLITRVALSGQTVNVSEFTASGRELWGDDERNRVWRDYPLTSMLVIPLKNSEGQTLGALQLINPRDAETGAAISFDRNLQQMMESFSSLAVAALEAFAREQKLRQEIQQLKIEIDEAKRQKQVSEIVESDFFKSLTARAKEMRNRAAKGSPKED